MILKTTVRLSHPAPMDLVLRKRVSLNIYKRQSITERLKKSKWLGRGDFGITQSGVTYEVVSNIPKASEELEDRESLAQLAASGDDSACDGETYIGECFAIPPARSSGPKTNVICQSVRTHREIHARCIGCRKYSNVGPLAAKRCHQGARAKPRPIAVDAKDGQRSKLLTGTSSPSHLFRVCRVVKSV